MPLPRTTKIPKRRPGDGRTSYGFRQLTGLVQNPQLKKEAAKGREMVSNDLVAAKTFSMELWPRCLGTVTGTDLVITSDVSTTTTTHISTSWRINIRNRRFPRMI